MKFFRPMVVTLALAVLLIGATALLNTIKAQDKQPVPDPGFIKVGVVDFMAIMKKYKRAEDLQEEIFKLGKVYQMELSELRKTIEDNREDIENLNPKSQEYVKQRKKIFLMETEHQNKTKLYKSAVFRQRDFQVEKIRGYITLGIGAVAQQKDIKLVLRYEPDSKDLTGQQEVLYSSTTLNITRDVIDHLNKQYTQTGDGVAP